MSNRVVLSSRIFGNVSRISHRWNRKWIDLRNKFSIWSSIFRNHVESKMKNRKMKLKFDRFVTFVVFEIGESIRIDYLLFTNQFNQTKRWNAIESFAFRSKSCSFDDRWNKSFVECATINVGSSTNWKSPTHNRNIINTVRCWKIDVNDARCVDLFFLSKSIRVFINAFFPL